MAHTEAPADVRWVVAVAGREESIVLEAATVENHSALGLASTIHSVGGSHGGNHGDVVLTTLRNAAGEIVFQAPTLSVAYLRRYGPPEHIVK